MSALDYLREQWVLRVQDFTNDLPRVIYVSPWLYARAKNEQDRTYGVGLRAHFPAMEPSDLPFKQAVLRADTSLRGHAVRFA